MTRRLIAGLGVLAGLYGAFLLLTRQDFAQITSAAIWLAGGVILHDFVLAPIVIVVLLVAVRFLPRPSRAPAVVGIVVLGSVTLLAIPVLGSWGAKADNATLLDRSYGTGWLVVLALTLLAVVGASVLRARRGEGADGAGPGRR